MDKEKFVEILKNILPTRGIASGIPIIQKWNYNDVADKLIENGVVLRTANTVEVVRCKDCVFCKYNEDANVHKCDRRGYFTEYVNPDKDYCSHGKT